MVKSVIPKHESPLEHLHSKQLSKQRFRGGWKLMYGRLCHAGEGSAFNFSRGFQSLKWCTNNLRGITFIIRSV